MTQNYMLLHTIDCNLITYSWWRLFRCDKKQLARLAKIPAQVWRFYWIYLIFKMDLYMFLPPLTTSYFSKPNDCLLVYDLHDASSFMFKPHFALHWLFLNKILTANRSRLVDKNPFLEILTFFIFFFSRTLYVIKHFGINKTWISFT